MPVRLRLPHLLHLANLTQADLADRTGIDRAIISRLCTDQTRRISLHTMDLISRALAVPPGDLFIRVVDPEDHVDGRRPTA